MSGKTISELLVELSDEYTREEFDRDFLKTMTRLCEKHGVATQAEVHEIIKHHRYHHTAEDPEDDYIHLLAVMESTGWCPEPFILKAK